MRIKRRENFLVYGIHVVPNGVIAIIIIITIIIYNL